jgi:site-specific recombinase XerC
MRGRLHRTPGLCDPGVGESICQACGGTPTILETAVEYGYLAVNAARGVKFPPQALRVSPALIAGDEYAKLLDEVVEPYRMMIGLIAATGLRIGELLALRWRAPRFAMDKHSQRERRAMAASA